MMPRTVLISAYTCCPNRGSEPGNGWNWIINYKNNGYKVIVLTSNKYKAEILAENIKGDLISFYFLDSAFSLRALKLPFIGLYIHYFFWIYYARIYINKNSHKINISHYHHVTYSSIKFGSPLYNLKLPIIIGPLGGASSPHKTLKKYFGKYWLPELIKEKITYLFVYLNPTIKKSINSAACILSSNIDTNIFLKNYSPKSIELMFDAGLSDVFKEKFHKKGLNKAKVRILWVGRVLPRKGLNLAIEAFYELESKKKDKYEFFVIGSGLCLKKCKETVLKYGLQNKVIFLGAVEHKLIVEYYRNSHIFLFPSLKDSCPMQVFEAMALGLPVISLDHQGMADQIIEGSGFKVPVGNGVNYPLELADAIIKATNDENEYNYLAANAYAQGQKQIWSSRINFFVDEVLPKYIK